MNLTHTADSKNHSTMVLWKMQQMLAYCDMVVVYSFASLSSSIIVCSVNHLHSSNLQLVVLVQVMLQVGLAMTCRARMLVVWLNALA